MTLICDFNDLPPNLQEIPEPGSDQLPVYLRDRNHGLEHHGRFDGLRVSSQIVAG
ncbi:MAG: hypothetical protein RL695_130 [Pseudomonadota bacterium]|jgi:hypothetical protein